MEALLITYNTRPSRIESVKNDDYHIKTGRWGASQAHDQRHTEFIFNAERNIRFYVPNKQWDGSEDVDDFLKDTTGRTNNRLKVELNYMQIIANQFIGNVCRMSVNSSAISFSPLVKERRMEKLEEMMFWTDVAQSATPNLKNAIQANKPIGNSPLETATIFGNNYVDDYVKGINNLLRYTKEINNIDLLKREVAESLAVVGMAVVKPEVSSREYRWRYVDAKKFFFDRNAIKQDLSDAAFMGETEDVLLSELYERCNGLGRQRIKEIESYRTTEGSSVHKPDRLKIFKVYWRDVREDTWGYVKNEFGDVILDRINYTPEDEEKPKYTDKDVLYSKDLTPHQLNIVNKKKNSKEKGMIKTYTDEWRFAEFVPSEYIGRITKSPTKEADLLLDSGVAPYQEYNTYSPFNMETPYKIANYMYIDGYTYSPLDIAINPQRITNRIMSVVENLLNNSHGANILISKEAVDKSGMSEAEIIRKTKQSEPLILPTAAFGGAQNAIAKYDGNITNSSKGLLDVALTYLGMIEKITGINEAMKGQMESPDQLVGTMKLMIQKGTVVTERYYTAIRELFRQCFQATAESGKRFYINEKPTLVYLTGDTEAEVLELSKDYKMEHFRVSVKISLDEQSEREFVDNMLFQLLQTQLIDRNRFANLIGRGTQDDMWYAVREYAKEFTEVQKVAEEQQQMQVQQQQQQQQGNIDRAFTSQDSDREAKVVGELIKAGKNNNQANTQ